MCIFYFSFIYKYKYKYIYIYIHLFISLFRCQHLAFNVVAMHVADLEHAVQLVPHFLLNSPHFPDSMEKALDEAFLKTQDDMVAPRPRARHARG